MKRIEFTKEMAKEYTILIPQMSPIHFSMVEPALRSCGYKVKVLRQQGMKDVNTGLKYVNNDACYPSLIVIGQLDVYKRQLQHSYVSKRKRNTIQRRNALSFYNPLY